jgi:hypothetical protein
MVGQIMVLRLQKFKHEIQEIKHWLLFGQKISHHDEIVVDTVDEVVLQNHHQSDHDQVQQKLNLRVMDQIHQLKKEQKQNQNQLWCEKQITTQVR